MRFFRRGLPFLFFSALACTGENPGGDRSASDNSEINVDALPRLNLVEEARIGSIEDPDYGFSRIGGVDVDRDGNVFVFESLAREIRVYSPDGRLLRRFGRSGEGPGEFSIPAVGFGVDGDTVWAVEAMARRLTLFDREGRVISATRIEEVTVPLYGPGETMVIQPLFLRGDGYFFGDRGGIRRLGGSEETSGVADTVYLPQIRFDAEGRVVDTVGWSPYPQNPAFDVVEVGSSQYSLPRPPRDDPLRINLLSGSIRIDRPFPAGASPATFRLTRLGLDGDAIHTRTFLYRPVPYPEVLLDSLAARVIRGGARVVTSTGVRRRYARDTALALAAVRDKMRFPDYQPPIRSYEIADKGTLWLGRDDTGTNPRRWIVLDAEDLPVGEVEVARGVRIAWTGSDTMWAVETDEFDVPWLVRYRIRPR